MCISSIRTLSVEMYLILVMNGCQYSQNGEGTKPQNTTFCNEAFTCKKENRLGKRKKLAICHEIWHSSNKNLSGFKNILVSNSFFS